MKIINYIALMPFTVFAHVPNFDRANRPQNNIRRSNTIEY
jgi:hypothetical protein